MGDLVQTNGMSCPRCGVGLLMTDRQGIEIDYCPTCRGVWLDRGELDKIIERSAAPQAAAGSDYQDNYQGNNQGNYQGGHGGHGGYSSHGGHGGHNSHGQRGGHGGRSFLSRIFD